LLSGGRRGPRRRRVPHHRRCGWAAGRTGRLLGRSAGRLCGARPASLRSGTRCSDVWRGSRSDSLRTGTRCGDVWRSSRCGYLRRGTRCGDVWCGRRVRGRRCVRGSCRGGARGWRSSSLFMLGLRGCGCRHRSRNDKNRRDAGVPLEHDTTSYVAHESTLEMASGFACEADAAYMGLTWRATNSLTICSELRAENPGRLRCGLFDWDETAPAFPKWGSVAWACRAAMGTPATARDKRLTAAGALASGCNENPLWGALRVFMANY